MRSVMWEKALAHTAAVLFLFLFLFLFTFLTTITASTTTTTINSQALRRPPRRVAVLISGQAYRFLYTSTNIEQLLPDCIVDVFIVLGRTVSTPFSGQIDATVDENDDDDEGTIRTYYESFPNVEHVNIQYLSSTELESMMSAILDETVYTDHEEKEQQQQQHRSLSLPHQKPKHQKFQIMIDQFGFVRWRNNLYMYYQRHRVYRAARHYEKEQQQQQQQQQQAPSLPFQYDFFFYLREDNVFLRKNQNEDSVLSSSSLSSSSSSSSAVIFNSTELFDYLTHLQHRNRQSEEPERTKQQQQQQQQPIIAVDYHCPWEAVSDKLAVLPAETVAATTAFSMNYFGGDTFQSFVKFIHQWFEFSLLRAEVWQRNEPLQTEAILYYVMKKSNAKIVRWDFHRTDMRYVDNTLCIPGVYVQYNCSTNVNRTQYPTCTDNKNNNQEQLATPSEKKHTIQNARSVEEFRIAVAVAAAAEKEEKEDEEEKVRMIHQAQAKRDNLLDVSDRCDNDDSDKDEDEDEPIQVYWINLDTRMDRRRKMEESYTTNSPWMEHVVNYKRRVSAFTCQDVYEMITTSARMQSMFTFVKPSRHDINNVCHYQVNEIPSVLEGRGSGTTDHVRPWEGPVRIVEIAVTMSHVLAVALSYYDNYEYTLIIEDDVMLDNADRTNRFRPHALQRLAQELSYQTKMASASADNSDSSNHSNNNNWLVHLYCSSGTSQHLRRSLLLQAPNVIIRTQQYCLGAQMYMLNHNAMKQILTVYVPNVLSVLNNDGNNGSTTIVNEESIKIMVRGNFGEMLQHNNVECIAEPALYNLVNYYTTTRPFGYQLSGTSNVNTVGASETPEQDFDNFFASSEERQNEIYEPIIDWVFDNQD